ncbi:helix-turn-helix transcriptional regulator [Anthocerotibacter panamensis]|uniref:helix-turn-helix transcriptional regulator n=1 Tax=Anthocerotibacter panamensis TaxID=2857077 RepID=UPI001C40246B|nr:WYL domain-containing protein [Anthocerotibacter panamensis]
MGQIDLASYRLLLLFKTLLEAPRTLLELNEQCMADPLLQRAYSDTQLIRDINCLRKWGCEIPKATHRHQRRYVLQHHPLTAPLTTAQQQALLVALTRDSALTEAMTPLLNLLPLALRETLSATAGLTKVIQDYPSLPPPERAFILWLKPKLERRAVIRFFYTRTAKEHIAEPIRIEQRDGRYYLLAYFPDWQPPKKFPLRLDYIRDWKDCPDRVASLSVDSIPCPVVYRLFPPLAAKYDPRPDEKITPEQAGTLLVSLSTSDFFFLKKRLLSYGSCCQVLSPPKLVGQMRQEIQNMVKTYEV